MLQTEADEAWQDGTAEPVMVARRKTEAHSVTLY